MQNHDQIGNRAFGERLSALVAPEAYRATAAITLLSPHPPLLFMGEEFGAITPFLFFCDFAGELAEAVRTGRKEEFARFSAFANETHRASIPDPIDIESFKRSQLDWACITQPPHTDWLTFYRRLLTLRQHSVVPLLDRLSRRATQFNVNGSVLNVCWPLDDDQSLRLCANLSAQFIAFLNTASRQFIYTTHDDRALTESSLPPWHVSWWVESAT